MFWKSVGRFKDVRQGDYVRLVRPRTVLPPEEGDESEVVIPQAAYEGEALSVNPRGEIYLDGHRGGFLEDGTFGEWFYEIYVREV